MKCLNTTLKEGETVLDVILAAKMAASRSEARRLFDQRVSDWMEKRSNGEM